MKVLCLGSLNIDMVYGVENFVCAKETISSISMQKFCGGKGLNQAIATKKAGANVYFGGKIGEDGDMLKEALVKAKVDISNISLSSKPTGNAIIQVDTSGQNCIIIYGGANMDISTCDIDSMLSQFSCGDYLLLQNEVSNLPYIIDVAHKKQLVVVLNPSPYNSVIEKCDLHKVDLLVINEVEGMAISGATKIDCIIEEISKKYKDTKILLTLGADGSVLFADGKIYKQSIYKTDVVDTTAAGDTFLGYFVASVINGESYVSAMEIASMASSICVSRNGASPSIPSLLEVKEKLK